MMAAATMRTGKGWLAAKDLILFKKQSPFRFTGEKILPWEGVPLHYNIFYMFVKLFMSKVVF
jgi:hypothetical protein